MTSGFKLAPKFTKGQKHTVVEQIYYMCTAIASQPIDKGIYKKEGSKVGFLKYN
jgi:hypothetical protein